MKKLFFLYILLFLIPLQYSLAHRHVFFRSRKYSNFYTAAILGYNKAGNPVLEFEHDGQIVTEAVDRKTRFGFPKVPERQMVLLVKRKKGRGASVTVQKYFGYYENGDFKKRDRIILEDGSSILVDKEKDEVMWKDPIQKGSYFVDFLEKRIFVNEKGQKLEDKDVARMLQSIQKLVKMEQSQHNTCPSPLLKGRKLRHTCDQQGFQFLERLDFDSSEGASFYKVRHEGDKNTYIAKLVPLDIKQNIYSDSVEAYRKIRVYNPALANFKTSFLCEMDGKRYGVILNKEMPYTLKSLKGNKILLKQVFNVLKGLHDLDLIHGDVHGKNFLVNEKKNKVKAIDVSGTPEDTSDKELLRFKIQDLSRYYVMSNINNEIRSMVIERVFELLVKSGNYEGKLLTDAKQCMYKNFVDKIYENQLGFIFGLTKLCSINL